MNMRRFCFAFLIGIQLSLSHLSCWFHFTFMVILRALSEIGKGLNEKNNYTVRSSHGAGRLILLGEHSWVLGKDKAEEMHDHVKHMMKSIRSNFKLKHTQWKLWLTFSATSSKCENKSMWKTEVGLTDIKIIPENLTLYPSCAVDQKTKIQWNISFQSFIWLLSALCSLIFWTAVKI